jgi:hypothetical protein
LRDEVIGPSRQALINHTKKRSRERPDQWDTMRLFGGAARPYFSSGRTGCEALAYGSRGLSLSRGLKSKPRRKGGARICASTSLRLYADCRTIFRQLKWRSRPAS